MGGIDLELLRVDLVGVLGADSGVFGIDLEEFRVVLVGVLGADL